MFCVQYLQSGGDLENNERIADIIAKSICTSKSLYMSDDQYQNMTSMTNNLNKINRLFAFHCNHCNFMFFLVLFQNYHYSVCVSNKKIHVSKIKHDPNALENDDIRVLSEFA